jgi:hypothetical protein
MCPLSLDAVYILHDIKMCYAAIDAVQQISTADS